MFERFTDRARRVVVLAQDDARGLGHNHIGTEHLLLGLIREQEGVAAKVLESMGISLEGVRRPVEEIIGTVEGAPQGHIPFTPRAKKVLELSFREALQLGHADIGTEHILLGLLREGTGVAADVLQTLGASLPRARGAVLEMLGAMQAPGVQHPESVPDPVQLEVFISNLKTEDFEPDPEVGGETHLLRDTEGLQAGLWRVSAGSSWEPLTFTLADNETILILRGEAEVAITGGPTLELAAGDMVSLSAGMETTWVVTPPFEEFWVLS